MHNFVPQILTKTYSDLFLARLNEKKTFLKSELK